MSERKPIDTAPIGQQILVWETDYGWLLAHKDIRYGWQLKSSGNFYSEMPASVVSKLTHWSALPPPLEDRK
jgi:hypothetical protein